MLAIARSAGAQACCVSAAAHEFAVVGRVEDAVVVAELGYEHGFGSYDSQSRYHRLRDAEVDDGVLTLGAGVRLFPRDLQVGAALPLRVQHRDLPGVGSSTRFGFGDASLALRYTLIDDPLTGIHAAEPASYVPMIDLIAGVRVPLGRAPDESRDETGADATGEGAWVALIGAEVTKFLTQRDAIQLRADYGYRFSHEIHPASAPASELDPGDEIGVGAAFLDYPSFVWSWGAFLDARFTTAAANDGVTVPRSASRRVRAGAHVTYAWSHPEWRSTLTLSTDPFWDGVSRNVPFAGVRAALNVRRSFL